MAFWEKKKKKENLGLFGQFPFNDDFENKFSADFKAMEDMLKSLMNPEVMKKMQARSNKPIISGFTLKMGPNGKMGFEQFGNVGPRGQKAVIKGEREPLVDVINKPKEITVIAELPGVDKREIKLKVMDKKEVLSIHVPNKFSKKVELPAKVKSKLAKANYKNGVLEVNLIKEKAGKARNSIPVE